MDTENKELIKQAEKIRKGYSSVLADEEEEELTFLDEVNNLLRIIFKDTPTDIYTILSKGQLEKWKKQKYRRALSKFVSSISVSKIMYFLLLATITAFLISEALPFYAVGAIGFKTYVKAILTEICFIFLSAYRTASKLELAAVSLLRVGIFCLMLFVITSEVTLQGTQDIAKIGNIDEQVKVLQKQVKDKEKEIDFYMKKNWGNNTRQRILERDKLAEKLRELKERQIKEGASKEVTSLIRYKTWGKAFFRLILMFISVLVSRRIFRF